MIAVAGTMRLPAAVPVHFDPAGNPDRWGRPWELLLVPAIGLLLFAFLGVLAARARAFNYPVPITPQNAGQQLILARRMILGMRAVLVWVFVFLLLGMLRIAQGVADGLSPLFVPFVLAGTLGVVVWYLIAAVSAK
jgi:uncharacterized membrane protein